MKLYLENKSVLEGESFGANVESEGEVVFTTGMTGYLEVLTDPSYYGQIVVFTFPLIGNYGVFEKEFLPLAGGACLSGRQAGGGIDKVYESSKIWVKGVILAEDSKEFSHELGKTQFAQWLKDNKVPALSGVDTRALTQVIREHGVLWGKLGNTAPKKYEDPLNGRYVPEVSPQKMEILEPTPEILNKGACSLVKNKTIAFMDCGAKNGIFRNFLRRGVTVIRLPFNQNPFNLKEKFDGIFFSNGPGDPQTVTETIAIAREALKKNIPIFGICLGNQMLALAAGGKTRKMKYGHRGVNQPVRDMISGRCLITTQNHGFEVVMESLPDDIIPWFENLNNHSNEGLQHKTRPVFATQFHPEACAGPEDAQYLFDEFIKTL